MPTPEVQQYINQQRAAGIADAQIRQTLSAQGWSAIDLDQAFEVVPAGPVVPQTSQTSRKYMGKRTGRTVFLAVMSLFIGLCIFFYLITAIAFWDHPQPGDSIRILATLIVGVLNVLACILLLKVKRAAYIFLYCELIILIILLAKFIYPFGGSDTSILIVPLGILIYAFVYLNLDLRTFFKKVN